MAERTRAYRTWRGIAAASPALVLAAAGCQLGWGDIALVQDGSVAIPDAEVEAPGSDGSGAADQSSPDARSDGTVPSGTDAAIDAPRDAGEPDVSEDMGPSCGAAGQSCCANSSCSGSSCCDQGACVASGGSCQGGSQVCSNGHCASCGGGSQACCAHATCNDPENVCSDAGTCSACGNQGMPCCPAPLSCVVPNLGCVKGSCTPCGEMGQACCTQGEACTGGDVGCNDAGVCTACGDVGEPCCANGCMQSYAACTSGTCVACGSAGAACCQTAPRCRGGASCSGNDVCQ